MNPASATLRRGFVPILSGCDLSRRRLPLLRADSGRSGPIVWLAACAHGDEVGGIAVIHEIFRRLRRSPLRRGKLHAFPMMNPIGFDVCARHVTHSEEDLNRSFPGSSSGSLAERIAALIFGTILDSKPALVLDLHNDWTRTIPYAVLDNVPEASADARIARAENGAIQAARSSGFPVVREPNPLRRTLSNSLLQRGVPALTIELGESRVVNEHNVALGVGAIWAILVESGLVQGWSEQDPVLGLPAEIADRILHYSSRPLCSHSGIIRFCCEPGEFLAPGKPLARVDDTFGRPREILRSDSEGLVLGVADSSVAFPGTPVAALGLLSPEANTHSENHVPNIPPSKP